MGTLFSSKAFGRDSAESDVDEVVVSESDTESDEEDKSDDVRTNEECSENIPDAQIPGTTTADPPLQSASQETELLPLLSDPDSSVPESESIQRECDAMEEELTQVATFAFI